MLVSDLSYSDYLGRLAIGKIYSGSVKANDNLICIKEDNGREPLNRCSSPNINHFLK